MGIKRLFTAFRLNIIPAKNKLDYQLDYQLGDHFSVEHYLRIVFVWVAKELFLNSWRESFN